jgi:hypothetical protein
MHVERLVVGAWVLALGLATLEGCGGNGVADGASERAGTGDARDGGSSADTPTDSMGDKTTDLVTGTMADGRPEAAEGGEAGFGPADSATDVDYSQCAAPGDFGSALMFDATAAREVISASTQAEVALVWYPFFKTPTPDASWNEGLGSSLTINLRAIVAPFGANLAPMTIDLATQAPDACGACVTTRVLGPNGVTHVYVATGGTLTVTALPANPPTSTSVFSGTLSNATFKKVSPTEDGCSTKIDTASFSAPVVRQDAN